MVILRVAAVTTIITCLLLAEVATAPEEGSDQRTELNDIQQSPLALTPQTASTGVVLRNVLPTHRPRYPWRAFFIALNLYNNAEVLPHLAQALESFLRDEVAPFFDVANRVFISIFSNGSGDSTAEDIDTILIPSLLRAGVSSQRIESHAMGKCCGGLQSRPPTMERIEWMSCVRNAAMRPLFRDGMELFSPSYQTAESRGLGEYAPVDIERGKEKRKPHDKRSVLLADKTELLDTQLAVLFFNDIYFDGGDVTTLLETNYLESQNMRRTRSIEDTKVQEDLADAEAQFAKGSHNVTAPLKVSAEREVELSNLWEGFDMACGMDFYFTFYDEWVTRGVDGRGFDGLPPYAKDWPTQKIFTKSNELLVKQGNEDRYEHIAAPVRCCWNGLAIIRGSMFLKHGISFRPPLSTQWNPSSERKTCYSSECLLICEDIMSHVTNNERRPPALFINPSVKVAYELDWFMLHRRHWFFSSSWYFTIVSYLRVGTWLFPATFRPPLNEKGEMDQLYVECLLPRGKPLLTGRGWLALIATWLLLFLCLIGLRRGWRVPILLQARLTSSLRRFRNREGVGLDGGSGLTLDRSTLDGAMVGVAASPTQASPSSSAVVVIDSMSSLHTKTRVTQRAQRDNTI